MTKWDELLHDRQEYDLKVSDWLISLDIIDNDLTFNRAKLMLEVGFTEEQILRELRNGPQQSN